MIIETTFMRGKKVIKHIFGKNKAMRYILDIISDNNAATPHVSSYFRKLDWTCCFFTYNRTSQSLSHTSKMNFKYIKCKAPVRANVTSSSLQKKAPCLSCFRRLWRVMTALLNQHHSSAFHLLHCFFTFFPLISMTPAQLTARNQRTLFFRSSRTVNYQLWCIVLLSLPSR